MILPIVAYGADVLRKTALDIDQHYPQLDKLIEDMWETMYASNGVGLAATQINRAIRLFVMDSAQIFEHQEEDEKGVYPDEPGIKRIFINANIISYDGNEWPYNEGCLDENFHAHTETFNGITARIIQHEYDHIEGKLFIDYLKPLKKKMLQGKLNDISKGKIKVDYKMAFPK